MVNVLVTGGAGMIGSNLVKRLIKLNFSVKVVDNLWRGKKEYLIDDNGQPVIDFSRDFHQFDLSIPNTIDNVLEDIDYVFHLADVVAGIDYVFNNQGYIFRQNLLINSNVINSVKKATNLKGFIYVGTACSFPKNLQSGVDAKPLVETDQYPAFPESAYGWSKLMGEYETFLLEQETSTPVSVLVLHNVYGTPCDYSVKRSQVIPSLIRKAIQYPQEPYIIWGNGQQGRAFVHVNDVVDALIATMNKGLGKGIIQIGPDTCTSIGEIARIVKEISGKNIDIIFDTSKPEGDKGRSANYSKARVILGWEPRILIKDGLVKTYEWIENQMLQS